MKTKLLMLQQRLMQMNLINEVNEDEVRQFSLELGAGPKRIKLVRESSGSAPPVFRYI